MSWVGNMYQKFESVCKEVDDIGSVKFIEKQAQNVTENVMKFYSTLAQVIVTPIGDLEFDEEIDQHLKFSEDEEIDQHLKFSEDEEIDQHLKFSEDEEIDQQEDTAPVISHVKSLMTIDEEISQQEAAASISQVKLLMAIEEEFANKTDIQSSVEDDDATDDDVDILQVIHDESVDTEESEESAFGSTSQSECYSCASSRLYGLYASTTSSASMPSLTDAASTTSSASMPSLTDAGASSAMNFNEIIPKMESNIFQDEDSIKSSSFAMALHNETIDIAKWYSEYISSQIDSNGNCSCNNDPSMESLESSVGSSDNSSCEITDLDKEVKLEESCVMVDYSTPHDDVSCEAQKQPSYKKKILDALSARKMLTKEYKELAILHGHNAKKCCQETSLFLRDSQTIQLNDSEWELI